jgi:hypothetical protein
MAMLSEVCRLQDVEVWTRGATRWCGEDEHEEGTTVAQHIPGSDEEGAQRRMNSKKFKKDGTKSVMNKLAVTV